jgi:quinol monooxygenase YgiN
VLARAICVVSLVVVIGCIGCRGGDKAPAVGSEPVAASAVPAVPPAVPGEVPRQGAGRQVVRLSKGSFPAEKYEEVRARLDAAKEKLVPAIRALRGCLQYWVAIDPVSNTMINVSLWETLADAKQMETLQAMRALAGEFIALGVIFEQPITNSQMLWDLSLGAR